jgi:hypothetical protein
MTTEQSKELKIGSRVYFDGDQNDRGTVAATHARYLRINWADEHTSFTGHNDMKRIELAARR